MTQAPPRPTNAEGTTFRLVGRRLRRVDSPERLTGRTRFTDDLNLPGALHARLVRSPHASARIVSFDTSAAEAMPGVVKVVLARDLPIPDVKDAVERRAILFALDRVLYAGQPVAAVLAETEAAAQDAAARVEVEYEVLPVVVGLEAAAERGAPLVREPRQPNAEELAMHGATTQTAEKSGEPDPPNVSGRVAFKRGDVAVGFRDADVIVEHTYRTSWIHQGYLEPQVCAATIDPLGNLVVYACTQALFHTRTQVARTLGLADHQVSMEPMPVGGGFGGKFGFIEPTVAALALAAGRSVRLAYTRSDEFFAADPAPETMIHVKVGARADGTLTTLQADLLFDSGSNAGSPVGIAANLMGSYYRWEHLQLDGIEVLTHKAGTGAYRAPGAVQGTFAIECTVDEVARALGMNPLELRLKNASRGGDTRADNTPWPKIGLLECLERALQVYRDEQAAAGPGEGVGVALGGWYGGVEPSSAVCRLESDGSLQIILGSVDLTGTNSAFSMITAESFGLDDAGQVRVTSVGTDAAPYAGATGGSKIMYTVGAAVKLAAEDARDQVFKIASAELEVSVDDLEIVDGKVQVRGAPTKAKTLKEIFSLSGRFGARHPPVMGRGQNAVTDRAPGMAVHVVRVRVDPETGHVKPVRYVSVQDVGRAINPALVEAQIHGGAVQGVGWGLFERMVFDEYGSPITASLMDYVLPTASQAPGLQAVLVEVPSKAGPYGAKGAGEPPVVPAPAALANAVRDACGARVTEIPITPERVYHALHP